MGRRWHFKWTLLLIVVVLLWFTFLPQQCTSFRRELVKIYRVLIGKDIAWQTEIDSLDRRYYWLKKLMTDFTPKDRALYKRAKDSYPKFREAWSCQYFNSWPDELNQFAIPQAQKNDVPNEGVQRAESRLQEAFERAHRLDAHQAIADFRNALTAMVGVLNRLQDPDIPEAYVRMKFTEELLRELYRPARPPSHRCSLH